MKRFSLLLALITAVVPQLHAEIVTIRDQLREKLVCTSGCIEQQSGTFQFTYTFDGIPQSNFDTLDQQSTLTLHLGEFQFKETLGSDPKYQPGDTSVSFQKNVAVPGGGNKVAVRVKASWKDAVLTVKLKGIAPLAQDPAAWTLLGTAPGTDKQASINVSLELEGTGTDFTHSFSGLPLTGTLTRKTKTVDSVTYDLDKVTLSGGI